MGRCRTYRYKIYPTSKQEAGLTRLLAVQCELYNAALEERRGAWRWERRSISYFDQCRTLTDLREVRPEVVDYGIAVCRGSLRRLDRAFGAFYRRCNSGETPGFPRFKSARRFDSVEWVDRSGWKLKPEAKRVSVKGVGDVKLKLHRDWRGTPKAITIKREGRSWWLSVRCVDVPPEPLEKTGKEVGADLGVVNLVATSDGVLVDGARFERAAAARLAAAQRSLSTKQCGSARRRRAVERVAACQRTVRNRRRDLAHQLSRSLVNAYDVISFEDLAVESMQRRPKPRPRGDGTFEPNGARSKSGLNRSIHDAGWGELLQMLAYKAEDAGRELVAVDPQRTSQRCSACGHVDAASRRSQAVFQCTTCGHDARADVNAARNILWAG
jgi:putative transposase